MKHLVAFILALVTAIAVILIHPVFAQSNCEDAYLDVCIPPSPPDLDCEDIEYRDFRLLPSDPHEFDENFNGVGCEQHPENLCKYRSKLTDKDCSEEK